MRENQKKRLGEILIEDGILSPENLEEALHHQKKEGGLIGQILIRLGYLSEEDLVAAIGKQLQIPYMPLSNYSINMEAAQSLTLDFCKKNLLLVFDMDEKHVWVALSDPLNEGLMEELEKKYNLKIQIFISTPTEVINMIDLVFINSSHKEIKKAS
jgi:type IV pilus assembly protein PilB